MSDIIWLPQPGPQVHAWTCPVDEIFYGGTRGGGKTDAAIGRQIYKAEKYGIYHKGIMIRHKYDEFDKIRSRWDELILMGLPARRVGGDHQANTIRFDNGATVKLLAIRYPEQADALVGQEYDEITIDEAPTIPFISVLIDKLKGCCRSPAGVPCSIFLTGNPGGVASSQIAAMYIGKEDGGHAPVSEGEVNRVKQEMKGGKTAIFSRVYIRSTLWDNKILLENDPLYEARLRSMHNKELVDAWLSGDWRAIVGQAFHFGPRHIIEPLWPIPSWAPIYMTYDWGFGAPFSIGWWWVDGDDRIYRFSEWYGWNKVTPNVGLRLTDAEVAEGIVKKEKEMGIWGRNITRIAGPDSFNKKANYQGGGQGDSTADEFVKYAMKLRSESTNLEDQNATLNIYPGDANRILKIRQFQNRLRVPDNADEMPMLVSYNTCKDFNRIIPTLCLDTVTGEDLADHQEDHVYDEACHICMARPQGAPDDSELEKIQESKSRGILKNLDSVSRDATKEIQHMRKELKKHNMEDLFWD
jgi:hypothetical protein